MRGAIIINILLGIAWVALCGQVAMADLYVLGRVYHTGEDRVWEYDNGGAFLRDFGLVTDPNPICMPGAIGLMPGGNLILMQGHAITEYSFSGQFIRTVATGLLPDVSKGISLGHVDESGGIYVSAGYYDTAGRIEKYSLDGSQRAVYTGHPEPKGIFADARGSVYAVGWIPHTMDSFTRWGAGGGEPEMSNPLSHGMYTADINRDDEEIYCLYGMDPSDSTVYVDDLDGALLRTISVTISPFPYWVDYDPVRRHLFVATLPAPGLIQELSLDGTLLDTYDMGDQGLITIYGMATNIPEPVTITLVGLGAPRSSCGEEGPGAAGRALLASWRWYWRCCAHPPWSRPASPTR